MKRIEIKFTPREEVKIQVGRYYVCVVPNDSLFKELNGGGAGWKAGLVLKATRVTSSIYDNRGTYIIWDDLVYSEGRGVWAYSVIEASEDQIKQYKEKYENTDKI